MNHPRPNLDDALASVNEAQWDRPPRRAEFVEHLLKRERRRARRVPWLVLPIAVLMCAGATYGTLRHIHRIETELDVVVDGESIGTQVVEIVVENGEIQPVEVQVGDDTVEIQLEPPDGIRPEELDGMRVETHFTTNRED